MKYQEWLAEVPAEITDDPIWKTEVYRLGLFLGDLAWYDSVKLTLKPPTRSLSDQLYRAAGNVSANTCEGYSRASGKDQARFYEYALGSARETRDWYFKARHVLGPEITSHRLKLSAQIIRNLLRMIPKYRGDSIREEAAEYLITPLTDLLENVPMPDHQFTHHALRTTENVPMPDHQSTHHALRTTENVPMPDHQFTHHALRTTDEENTND